MNNLSYTTLFENHITLLANEFGAIKDIPVQRLIALQSVFPDNVLSTEKDQIRKKFDVLLRDRKKYLVNQKSDLLKEIDLVNNALGESYSEKSNKGAVRENPFLGEDEARLLLYERLGKGDIARGIANIGIRSLRRELFIVRKSIDDFVAEYDGYEHLDFADIKEVLEVDGGTGEVKRILSSYPGDEIKDIVRIINPYNLLREPFYVIKQGVNLDDLLPKLENIRDSLYRGDFSYFDAVRVLDERMMQLNSPLLDSVIESVFERKDDGTYTKDSANEFKTRTAGYRFFFKLEKLFGSNLDRAMELLSTYKGTFIIPISLVSKSLKNDDTKVVYMFKCNYRNEIDLNYKIRREIGLH